MATPALADTAGPSTPTSLTNDSQACVTDPASAPYINPNIDLTLSATSQDSATDTISLTFQFWPVSDPSQTTSYTETGISGLATRLNVPGTSFTDGQAYAWDAQASDSSGDASAWSTACYFIADKTNPANPPTVTSPNYPTGQQVQGGDPIQLDLGANGISDVKGYVFGWNQSIDYGTTAGPDPTTGIYTGQVGYIPASSLGGPATAELIPPPGVNSQFLVLTVVSEDRAGNPSAETFYDMDLKSDVPTVTDKDPNAGYGQNARFAVTASPGLEAVSPVVSYTVTYQGDSTEKTLTVKASKAGNAKFKVPLDDPNGVDFMSVESTSANGWTSQVDNQFLTFDTSPVVSSNVYLENDSSGGVGVPGTFTFTTTAKGIASYTYTFGGTPVTIKAHGDKPVTISWTPDASGFYDLNVFMTTKDGVQLPAYDYFFLVN